MSKGTVVTLLFMVALAGLSVSMILGGNNMRCEVCIEYNGIEVCERVEGKDKDRSEMVQLGISTACAGAANGRTESMDCSATPPVKVECTATDG